MVYTHLYTLVYTLPPWVHHASDHPSGVHSVSAAVCALSAVRDEEALGSNQGLIKKREDYAQSGPPFLSSLLGRCAQSYSVFLPRSDKRLDRRRVNLPKTPYGRHVCAEWSSDPLLARVPDIREIHTGGERRNGKRPAS